VMDHSAESTQQNEPRCQRDIYSHVHVFEASTAPQPATN